MEDFILFHSARKKICAWPARKYCNVFAAVRFRSHGDQRLLLEA
jgi:hypothetical protein